MQKMPSRNMIVKLKEKYINEVLPAMKKEFGYKNIMAVPKIEKVVINTSFGRMITEKTSDEKKKIKEAILNDLSFITGQRPVLTKAKKSISSFKVREGMEIGAKVTLRKKKMYDFLERLIHITLPRSRDFQGINPKSIDKEGNLTMSVKEHISFPEISPEKTKILFGFELTVVTTAKNKEQGLELFKLIGFPMKK